MTDVATARAHFESGHPDRALSVLEELLTGKPADRESLLLTGLIQRALGHSELADSFEFLADNPDDLDELYDRGYHLIEAGGYAIAAAFLGRAHTIDRDHPEILYEYAWALFKSGRFAESIPLLERSHSLEPNPETLDTLATAWALQGDAAPAREALREAEKICTGDDDRLVIEGTRDLITRLELHPSNATSGLRHWHWIQCGGALLREEAPRPDSSFLADLLADLATLSTSQNFPLERVLFVDPAARGPAESLARSRDITVEGLGDEPRPGSLVIVSSSAALVDHLERFDRFSPGEVLCCLIQEAFDDFPLCADVVGFFSDIVDLPGGDLEIPAETPSGEAIVRFYRDLPLPLTRDRPGRRPELPYETPIPRYTGTHE